MGDAEHVHLDAGRHQRHCRPHMPGTRRRVQRDRRPDILDVALADAVASEEIPRRIVAIDLEAQIGAAMGRHQPDVMEHGADIGAARDHRPSPCVPSERAPEEDAAAVVIEQAGLGVPHQLGGSPRQGAVGNGDAGDGLVIGVLRREADQSTRFSCSWPWPISARSRAGRRRLPCRSGDGSRRRSVYRPAWRGGADRR